MPKATDITGTFRVPEEAWGRFWNVMLSIPGADVSPNVRAEAPAKKTNGKTAQGTTGKCIALHYLAANKGPIGNATFLEHLTAAGKSAQSVPNILYELKKLKHIRGSAKGYTITPAGTSFLKTKCNKVKE